jgi:hypothetical protein
MTTLANQVLSCGHCGESSEHTVLLSTNTVGSPDLDLRPSEMQRSTMHTWLQLCPDCGYCAPDISTVPVNALVYRSKEYQAALNRDDYPELARRFLAYAHSVSASAPASAGQAFLHVAWVCDDAGRTDQSAECRRWAVEWFRRCKPFSHSDEGLARGAVLVDVLRRCGQFEEASAECAELLAVPGVTGVLREVLQFQQRLIGGADLSVYLVSDCHESA